MTALLASLFRRAIDLAAPVLGRLLGAKLFEETAEDNWLYMTGAECALLFDVSALDQCSAKATAKPVNDPGGYFT